MNVVIIRSPGNKPGPDIVDPLLSTEAIGRFRGQSEINHNDSSRKSLTGNGPKNEFMMPCKLVQIEKKGSRQYGILTMYSRSYNKADGVYTIDSAVAIETKIKDVRPATNETSP